MDFVLRNDFEISKIFYKSNLFWKAKHSFVWHHPCENPRKKDEIKYLEVWSD
jgi:hypothetical protein